MRLGKGAAAHGRAGAGEEPCGRGPRHLWLALREDHRHIRIAEVAVLAMNGIKHPQFRPRRPRLKIRKAWDQPADCHGGDDRNRQCRRTDGPARFPAGRIDVRKRQRQRPAEVRAVRAEARAVALAVEQRPAQPLLQMPYLVADGRLRHAKFVRGAAEAAVARNRLEDPQCVERRLCHGRSPVKIISCVHEKPSFDNKTRQEET